MRDIESNITPALTYLDERACARQQTVVFARQAYPNAAVMTYDKTRETSAEYVCLVKFVLGIGNDSPVWLNYNNVREETTQDNIPGGLKGKIYPEEGREFTSVWYPCIEKTESEAWEGAALLHIHSDTPQRFWLKFGSGNIAFMHFSPNEHIKGEQIDCENGSTDIEEQYAIISRMERTVITSVRGEFESLRTEKAFDDTQYGTYAVASMYGTDCYVMVGYSTNKNRAKELSGEDFHTEEQRVISYYERLLEHWKVITPDKNINEAFTHALLNTEYSWLYPYGWIESFQHWPTVCHIEQSACEEWNKRYDRVRTTLKAQMERVFPSGAIPSINTTGHGRRDWGGENQFFLRDVCHYVRMTGDIEFARQAEPYMERALAQTFEEYDPTYSGILGWNTQIGNQEDFEGTPGKGAATGSEGVRMLEIMSEIKAILGKQDEAEKYKAYAKYCLSKWYSKLWLSDIGRPGWFIDNTNEMRRETTYHGILYPIIYDQIDDCDKMSAIDHIKNRLSGPEGEIYQTNHFADHAYDAVPTWGMQCGSDMQPFASSAYASLGMKEEAVRPLAFIAKRVCGEYQRGSWPETANEKRFAYFSPSSALYAQSIIESIFGITRNLPKSSTNIAPCIPESWPDCSLEIPNVRLEYKNLKCGFEMNIRIEDDTQKSLTVRCPVSKSITLKYSGNVVRAIPKQICGHSEMTFDIGSSRDISLKCSWEPIEYTCEYDKVISLGEALNVKVTGKAKLIGLYDKLNLFKFVSQSENHISAKVRDDAFEAYKAFGMFGYINFARRSFFLKLEADGIEFMQACCVTVLPPVWIEAEYTDNMCLHVYNQTSLFIGDDWKILVQGKIFEGTGMIPPGDKGDVIFNIKDITLSPGKNKISVISPLSMDLEAECLATENVQKLSEIPLDGDACKPLEYWNDIFAEKTHGYMLLDPGCFLRGLFEEYKVINVIPGVPMKLDPKGFIPISRKKHTVARVDLQGRRIKKLYVLFSSFIDNHNVFSKIFDVEVECRRNGSYIIPILRRSIYYPGNTDMGFGNNVIAGFPTYRDDNDRSRQISFPSLCDSDYPQSKPPIYPQMWLWSDCKAFACCNAVFDLLEIDLERAYELEELRFIAACEYSCGGIFSVTAEIDE